MIINSSVKEVKNGANSIVKIMGGDKVLWEIPKPFKLYKLQDTTVFDKVNPPSGSETFSYTYKLRKIANDEMMWFAFSSSMTYESDFQLCYIAYGGSIDKVRKVDYGESIFEYNGIIFYRSWWEWGSEKPNDFYLTLKRNPTTVTHNAIILKKSTIEQEQEILKQFSF